jgi:predicted amidohydrolase
MPEQRLTVGLAQIAPRLGNLAANAEVHLMHIKEAVRNGCDLVIFPELSLTGYTLRDQVPDCARQHSDKLIRNVVRAAKQTTIVFGFVEQGEDYRFYNAAIVAERGEIVAVHRKSVLPTYGMFDEGRFFAPGNRIGTINLSWGKLGLLICEEAWHPVNPYLLWLDGALFTVQIANGTARGRHAHMTPGGSEVIWNRMNSTYAALYSQYLLFCNRVGFEEGVNFWGGSEIVSPDGFSRGKLGPFEETLLIGEVDLSEVRRARSRLPLRRDERLDLVRRTLDRIAREEEP